MITSIYDYALSYKGMDTEGFFEKMASCTQELFQPIYQKYGEREGAKNIVLYIIYAYSLESKIYLLKSNWSHNKKMIGELVDLPLSVWNNVVNLECPIIKKAISDYLELQGDQEFRHLKMNEDVYECILKEMFVNIHDEEMKINSKFLNDTRATLNKIQEEIITLRTELYEKYKVYKENQMELGTESQGGKRQTANVATSPHIKRV